MGRVLTQDFVWDSHEFTNRTNLKETWKKNADLLFIPMEPNFFNDLVTITLQLNYFKCTDRH